MLRAITVKLPDRLIAEIEAEARSRRVSRSEVIRERLLRSGAQRNSVWEGMQDLVVHEHGVPADSALSKSRLRGYGRSSVG